MDHQEVEGQEEESGYGEWFILKEILQKDHNLFIVSTIRPPFGHTQFDLTTQPSGWTND